MKALLVILLLYSGLLSAADYKTCNDIRATLLKAGLSPVPVNLTQTEQDDFPYNILLTFDSENSSESYAGYDTEEYRNTILLDISQKDFLSNTEQILNILLAIKSMPHKETVYALISSYGSPQLSGNDSVRGAASFCQSLASPDRASSLVVHFGTSPSPCTMAIGSGKDTAPAWLAKHAAEALAKAGIPFDIISGNLPSLYHFDILRDDIVVSSYLENNIPCVAVTIQKQYAQKASDFVSQFIDDYDIEDTDDWDRHYISVKALGRIWWIKETYFVSAYLAMAVISLLFLCGFSFTLGKNKQANWIDFKRNWHRLPLMIFVCACILQISQSIAPYIQTSMKLEPILLFAIKLSVLFIAVALLFTVEFLLGLETSFFVYGFQITLVSVFNIFLFSAFDISLLILFSMEYAIAYLARTTRRIVPLLLSGVCIISPFVPYCLTILKYADSEKMRRLVYLPFSQNIALSCALQPLVIIWLKIFSRLFIRTILPVRRMTVKTSLKMCGSVVFITAAIGAFFSCMSWFLKHHSSSENYNNVTASEQIQNMPSTHVSLSVSSSSYQDDTLRLITVKSKIPATRYIVTVQGKEGVPVYDAVYRYEYLAGGQKIQFLIPDYPPQSVFISFTAGDDDSAVVTVQALYQQGYSESSLFTLETCSLVNKGGVYEPLE